MRNDHPIIWRGPVPPLYAWQSQAMIQHGGRLEHPAPPTAGVIHENARALRLRSSSCIAFWLRRLQPGMPDLRQMTRSGSSYDGKSFCFEERMYDEIMSHLAGTPPATRTR